jgi:hypothetical protein
VECDEVDENGKCINLTLGLLRKIKNNYSRDEATILRDMLRRGKGTAYHAVDYIVSNSVHIYLADLYPGIGAKWKSGNVYVSDEINDKKYETLGDVINSGYYGWLVGIVSHEAKHLEQGLPTALSVYGEFEGWKTELEVKREMFQQVPKYGTAQDMILRTPLSHDPDTLGMVWRGMVGDQGFDYFVWVLPLNAGDQISAFFAPH